jgi:hypothetical protein
MAGKNSKAPTSAITTTRLPAIEMLRSTISGNTISPSRLTATAPPE